MESQIFDNQAEPQNIESMSDEQLAQLEASVLGTEEPAPEIEEQPETPKEEEPPSFEKVINDQKTFIGKQSTEIGELRKMVTQLQSQMLQLQQPKQDATPAEPKPDENEEFFKAPIDKVKAILEEREKAKEQEKQAGVQTRQENRTRVIEALPDFDELVKDAFAVLLQDGFTEEAVIEFAKDPWKERPEALIALGKRARAERKLRELEEGKQAQPAQTARPKVTAPKNPITAAVGNSRNSTTYLNGLSDVDIAKMSDDELNAILKKAGG